MSVEIGAIASQDEHEQQFGVHARRGHLILSQTPYSRIQTFAQEHVLDFSGTFSLTKVTAESANSPDWPDEINYKCTNIGAVSFLQRGVKMSQVRQEQPSMLARAEEIQRQIQELSGRDMQLWSIVSLVILVLTGGFLALVAPNLVWAQRVVKVEEAYLPQLFFGLICLVVLFNVYLLSQRVALNSTRKALISELVLNERLESLSLVDPLTQLLNRRALNELIPHQLARANRSGNPLAFMM